MKVFQVVQEVAANLVNSNLETETINLKRALRLRLREVGFPDLKSTELADEWVERLQEEINNRLKEWDLLGIPRPLIETNSTVTLFTFRHPKYSSLVGVNSLPSEYVGVLEFVKALSTRDFLLVPICLLYLAGCDPIIFTDGAGDEGVDCMGQVTAGPMRSLCIFVQAKAGSSLTSLDKNTVRVEYAKFQDLLQPKATFSQYLAALGKSSSMDGRSVCYVVACNSEFERPAREYAFEKGILLRSIRQSAFWLSQHLSVENLEEMRNAISPYLKRDLNCNLRPLIAPFFDIRPLS